MKQPGFRAATIALFIATFVLLGTPGRVAAECTQLDTWPSFRAVAHTADQILVGEVVESYQDDSTGRSVFFRLRVNTTIRGDAVQTLEVREAIVSGEATICPGDSILRVHVGDVIALAFGARVSGVAGPVTTAAFVRGVPHGFLNPGIERLTLAEVRLAAGMPTTDTAQLAARHSPSVPLGFFVLTALLGAIAAGWRLRRVTT